MAGKDNNQDFNAWIAQSAIFAFSLTAKKDKINELLNKLYDDESGKLKLLDWPRRMRSFGRMITAFYKGEYKNISPFFWINTAIGVTYLMSNFKINGKKLLNLGILDDIAVMIFILDTFGDEIRKFEMWEVDQHVKSIELA